MGQGAIDYIGVKGGLDINGIIEDYYVYAGEKVSAGDFVEFINGIASSTKETSVDTLITSSVETDYMFPVLLSNGNVFICYGTRVGSTLYGMVCSVEGAKIVPGTQTTLSTQAGAGQVFSAELLSNDNIFIAYRHGNTSKERYLYGMTVEVEGTTLTVKNTKQLASGTYAGYYGLVIKTILIDTDKIYVAHSYQNNYALAGLVVSVSSSLSITTGTDVEVGGFGNGSNIEMYLGLLEPNKVFIACGESDELYGYIAQVSNTTISLGNIATISTVQNASYYASIVPLSSDKVFIAHN